MVGRHRVEMRGPYFKPEQFYLTNEGYPLGTTCWYFIIWSNGLRELCCGDTEEDAWKKALRFLRDEHKAVRTVERR